MALTPVVAGGDPLAALVARFLAGRDEAAFRELYRAATPRLWAFALRLAAGDAARAEELVQEAWTRAVERLDRWRGDAALASWLGGIVLNCWRESRRELRWLADEAAAIDVLDRRAERVPPLEGALDLEAALAALPDGSRAVLLLHDLEGLTHDEIGDRLGIAAGTSKSRLFAARRAVARRLAAPAGGAR
jgi:RNA polymerase sigma-70 factor (ECF subfamily)